MQSAALLILKKINKICVVGTSKQRCQAKRFLYASGYAQHDSGFTLIEVLVVVLMVGVLSTILAPGWISFVNRQRVNKANDAVLGALQEAQREAKKTKRNYNVSFRINNNVPQIAINPSDSNPNWVNLGGDLGIQPGQVILSTNLSDTTTNTVSSTSTANPTTITFDYMGTLPNPNFGTPPTGSSDAPGLKIAVAVPKSGSTTEASGVKRCVIVKTLIGGIRTAKNSDCN